MPHPTLLDFILLLITGLVAAYMLWRLWGRYAHNRALYDIYYMMGFAVLLVAGLLLLALGYGVLASPYLLTVATLIPLGISMGLVEQYYPRWKRGFKWFALAGFLAIAISSIAGVDILRRISVPLFHGVAGLVIIVAPFLAKKAAPGFQFVGVGGALISTGGMALAFLKNGRQLLFFSESFVMAILAALLLGMALAFAYGLLRDLRR